MRKLAIFHNHILAGVLIEVSRDSYIFTYENDYFKDKNKPAISLTLPKNKQTHKSQFIFPFFSNMIAEGENLVIQTKSFKIDDNDILSLLEKTAQYDSIGSITVRKLDK